MTKLLEQAWAEIQKLPADEQDKYAQWLLAELQGEETWDTLFANSLDILARLADEALADFQMGKTEKLDPDNL